MDEVRDFFERSAEGYRALDAGMAPFHRVTASRIEAALAGDVLSLGGLWAQAGPVPEDVRLVVADLALSMLCDEAISGKKLVCDGRRPALRPSSFDHIVLPLMLHHVTGRTFGSAREGAGLVLARTRELMRPGGRLWISDFCTSGPVYLLQRLCTPLTRALLSAYRQPLVVMHTKSFYRDALERAGWSQVSTETVRTPDVGPLDWVRPVIAVPWLRVPRLAYPLTPTIITAVAQ